MHIEHPHELSQQEAIERLDHFLEGLMQRQPPGGVTIKNPTKDWDGNRMHFSFTAAKGFFGTSINGLVRVEGDRVVMDAQLPALVRGLVGEDRIRDTISEELRRLLHPDNRR